MTKRDEDSGDHMVYGSWAGRRVIRTLIRTAKAHGAARAEVWSGDDEPDYRGIKEWNLLDAVFAADMTAIVFRDVAGKRLGTYQITPYEGATAIQDYGVNPWTDAVAAAVDPVVDSLMAQEARGW